MEDLIHKSWHLIDENGDQLEARDNFPQARLPVPPPGGAWIVVPYPADAYVVVAGEVVPMLSHAITMKLAEVSAQFEREVLRGCASPKGWVDCDDKSHGRIGNLVDMRERAMARGAQVDPEEEWTMFDKSQILHNHEELIDLGLAIGLGFKAKFKRKQQLEAQIAAAVSVEDLNSIDVAAGWP